ncbi:hypothetical protein SAMN04487830_13331 [Pseudobutyrivibrio sp. OR37]|uniref:hypothetical protein n=1 Tax=Pseudobutyrivibrio sp. OR37 TaxID=1798186 RepID=UPI0008E74FBF|nr:hypothetical protein [Pseudobutyrivibrio sp. OR37]SFI24490.1 hypothetical protein SAMN04487830_13331 [Pseudobutyrivibrio sp. OR37]
MLIFEFDTDDRMAQLEKSKSYVELINDGFSDKRSDFRSFASDIEIDFDALETCCKCFEHNLLIDAYTYSEQLIKNMYYELLEKGRSQNYYIETFIGKKIPQGKFSPDVKYENIEKGIKSDLMPSFRFTLTEGRDQIKSYNELIQSRHTYAHRGQFMFSNDYLDVIEAEKYITKEIEMIVSNSVEYRIEYQRRTFELVKSVNVISGKIAKYKRSPHPDLRAFIQESVKILRRDVRGYIKSYEYHLREISLLNDTYRFLDALSHQDLRKWEQTCDLIIQLQSAMKNECIRKDI